MQNVIILTFCIQDSVSFKKHSHIETFGPVQDLFSDITALPKSAVSSRLTVLSSAAPRSAVSRETANNAHKLSISSSTHATALLDFKKFQDDIEKVFFLVEITF